MRSQSPGRAQKLNWSAVSSAWQRYLTHWRLIDNGLVGFVLRAARLAVSAAALRLRPTAESLAQRFEAPLDLLDAFATLLGAKSADWSPFYARQAVALCLLDTIAGDLQHYLTCWGLFKTIKAVGRIVHSVAYVSLLTCVDDSERRVRLKHSVSMLQVMCDLTRRQWVVEADNSKRRATVTTSLLDVILYLRTVHRCLPQNCFYSFRSVRRTHRTPATTLFVWRNNSAAVGC